MRRAGRGVTEDSAADVHCRLLDRRRPRAWAGSCRQRDVASSRRRSPAGRWISGSLGVNRQNVGDRETFSRTWIFVIIHDGGGGVRRDRRGSVVGSHDTVQRPARVRCADCARDVVLVHGRVLTGVLAERRRLGDAVDPDARYRAMSVGGRPASGPPVSGTEPRWVGRRTQVDVPPAQLYTREARICAGSVIGSSGCAGVGCACWPTPAADQDPPGSRGEPRISIT